jgi:hypothetical protein
MRMLSFSTVPNFFNPRRKAARAVTLMILCALLATQGMQWYRDIQAMGITGTAKTTDRHRHPPLHSMEICSHHPNGCPKDCMCPKLSATENESPDSKNGRVAQPYLARCTEKDSIESPPTFSNFLRSEIRLLHASNPGTPVVFTEARSTSTVFLDLPEPVPRA